MTPDGVSVAAAASMPPDANDRCNKQHYIAVTFFTLAWWNGTGTSAL